MPEKSRSYIFISGGVLSALGKGTTTASLAMLLKAHGKKVTVVKCENYLNIDAGLINPIEHGDSFLCEDGTEADMDLGTYEKFLDQDMSKNNFITMGQIYQKVLKKERNFGYKGEDVEAIPHVTDEIIRRFQIAGNESQADIVIIELGGTAGEYQNALYYEAARILNLTRKQKTIHIHVSYVPTPPHIGEPKTKPTQLSVKILNSLGIQPDFIVARGEQGLDQRRRERFALFCNVVPEHIIDAPNLDSIYELPLLFRKQQFDKKILQSLNLPSNKKPNLKQWENLIKLIKKKKKNNIRVAIVGKYFTTGDYKLSDSYISLIEALNHAAVKSNTKLNIQEIDSQKLEKQGRQKLRDVNGIIIPIGWGPRGVEGKLEAIKFARENKIPFLGLCYGMQLAVVEFAKHVIGWKDAHTTEVNPDTRYPVIQIIPEQKRRLENRAYGGTMRLGAWDCIVKKGSLAWKIYASHSQFANKASGLTSERHRHRYEFNNEFLKDFNTAGMIVSGRSKKENLVEIIELPQSTHPFFLGTQGHPEYKSRPLKPHAIFLEFINSAIKHSSD